MIRPQADRQTDKVFVDQENALFTFPGHFSSPAERHSMAKATLLPLPPRPLHLKSSSSYLRAALDLLVSSKVGYCSRIKGNKEDNRLVSGGGVIPTIPMDACPSEACCTHRGAHKRVPGTSGCN